MNSKTIELGPERWSRVEDLFEQAVHMKVAARGAFLDAECADDIELRDYLFQLLEIDRDIDATMERAIADTAQQAFADDLSTSDELEGEIIGPYRVERLLGSGGMGMVYLAKRDDQQFDQKVAIKLGRHRLVDPQTELRLRNERQILSDLDHPNIARLLDGSTTSEGVPYIVMEYINGVRIDLYCDRCRLSIVERLRLFQSICTAVHYAHQNLVIHRDIKAENILVTEDGTPKLLDFGIAKLTDTQGAATDGLTREGAVIMTTGNAAPEQLLGKPVTTATDIYALGLLLHRLLTGLRPYPIENLTPAEFARIVLQKETLRPSARLAQKEQTARRADDPIAQHELDSISSDRGTTLKRLQKRLHGDLDTIILSALRKEPERRYRSAVALSDDIDRHLKSIPIVARADSWRYRAGKFVRRHVVAVSVATAVVGMLATFTVLLSIQNERVLNERDRAQEVSRFLEEIFVAPDPEKAKGNKMTAEEILAEGAARIRNDLNRSEATRAALMATIGRSYFNIGELQTSAEMLDEALRIQQQMDSSNDADVAATKIDLAETLFRLADYERSEALLRSALEFNQREYGANSLPVAEILVELATLYLATGDLDRAQDSVESSIDTYTILGDPDVSLDFAEAKGTLARVLQTRGDLDSTEALFLDAIRIVENAEGPDHPHMAYYLQNLGVLQLSKGDLDAAEATLSKAIASIRRILGEKHDLLASTLINQGNLLYMRGDYDGAIDAMRNALSIHTETRGENHPLVGYDMTELGRVLHDKTDLSGSEDMLRGALAIYEQVLHEEHQWTASALTELGAVLNSRGQLAEAQRLLRRAIVIRAKDYPADHELVAATRTEYADNLLRLGRYDEARPLLQQSLLALIDKPGRRLDRANDALARLDEKTGRSSNQ